MQKNLCRAVLGGIFIALASANAWAAAENDAVGGADAVFVEDFEQGFGQWRLTAFRTTDKPIASIFKEKGNSVLALGGTGLAWQKASLFGREFKDFVLEVDIKKGNLGQGYTGVAFRRYNVFFKQGGVISFTIEASNETLDLSSKSFDDIAEKYRRLKIVCAGPVIRVHVDDEIVFEEMDSVAQAGPIRLLAHAMHGYFANVKINPDVPAEQYVAVEPVTPDKCLVFPPEKEVSLPIQVSNGSGAGFQVGLRAAVKTLTNAGQPITGRVTVAAGGKETLTLNLGKIPGGFHKVELETMVNGKMLGSRVFPLAIQHRGSDEYAPPVIPVAVYWRYGGDGASSIAGNTYMHAAACDLKAHGFNCVVASAGMISNQVDILKEYGISVMSRSGKLMAHPAVIGTLVSDEPATFEALEELKKQYGEIRKSSDKIITTCMIGDALVSRKAFRRKVLPPLEAWEQLEQFNPKVRLMRWYGIHKGYYGVLRNFVYKDQLSFVSTLMLAQMSSDTPYWIILPSFGADGTKTPNGYWTVPLPADIKCMMHLSLAYGARGLFFYTYQTERADWPAFVNETSLEPNGGIYAAAAEVAEKIVPHAALINALHLGGGDFRCDDVLVEVVPLDNDDKDSGRVLYIYVVNKANDKKSKCRLFNLAPTATLRDIYMGREFKINSEKVALDRGEYETGVARLELEPGDGMLLEYKLDWEKPVRVKYPEWVEKVPETSCLYLVDQTPKDPPRPGWLPPDKQWGDMNGDVTLFGDAGNPNGIVYKKSVYAHAPITIAYEIPKGYNTFVAAAGFGASSGESSVVLKVFVDGKEKYSSGVFKIRQPVPVVVDVKGGKELKLVTEDAGDGIAADYAWWGDARLLKK